MPPPPLRTLLVARHGETDWNRLGRFQGHTDVPLNETGRAQAVLLARKLERAGVGAVITSDLLRARETGEIVARELGVTLAHVDARLRERGYGAFEGLTRDECAERHPAAYHGYPRVEPPGAEPRVEVARRIVSAFTEVAERIAVEHRAVLVVSHGAAIRLFFEAALDEKLPPLANTAVYEAAFDGRAFVRVRVV